MLCLAHVPGAPVITCAGQPPFTQQLCCKRAIWASDGTPPTHSIQHAVHSTASAVATFARHPAVSLAQQCSCRTLPECQRFMQIAPKGTHLHQHRTQPQPSTAKVTSALAEANKGSAAAHAHTCYGPHALHRADSSATALVAASRKRKLATCTQHETPHSGDSLHVCQCSLVRVCGARCVRSHNVRWRHVCARTYHLHTHTHTCTHTSTAPVYTLLLHTVQHAHPKPHPLHPPDQGLACQPGSS
jgi:hypothetical protein